MELTQELVQKLFEYKDGKLYWRESPRQNVKAKSPVGHLYKDHVGKYRIRLSIKRKRYFASQIIFLYHKGWLPTIVDHRDNNPLNDKIENLRAANRFQNARNRSSAKNSSSRYLGVCLRKNGKWVAHIRILGKLKHLGYHFEETDAALAYNKAAIEFHGEFANLNNV